jgi:hypothetical protein
VVSKQKPRWYDDWEIITYPREYGEKWVKKVIKLPHSATIKEKTIHCETGSLVNELILDLECALYTLTERDKK